jgi:hypothetical protein
MVATLEALAVALPHRNGASAMGADVVKATQSAILPTGDDKGLADDFTSEKIAGTAHLIGAADGLPGLVEDAFTLQVEHTRVGVPGSREREGL